MTQTTTGPVAVALIVNMLAFLLPHFGVTIGSDALTTTISTVIILISSIVAYVNHKGTVKALRGARGLQM